MFSLDDFICLIVLPVMVLWVVFQLIDRHEGGRYHR